MSAKVIEAIEKEQFKEGRTGFGVGDKIKVFTKVKEGDKERTQLFAGTVIARRGRGLNEQFTVRRISYGEGVERIFPLHSPRIEKIEVETKGNPRRAKLFYLRNRSDSAVREVVETRKK
jgi:large subunit ribosomal protein L19